MKEIVTINGTQFELTTDHQLTDQERQQAILDITEQLGHISNIGDGIQTLAAACIDVTVKAPALISITSVTISGDTCPSGTCGSIICTQPGCTDTVARDIIITFTNTGDLAATVTPTLTQTVDGNAVAMSIGASPPDTLVPRIADGGTATATFTGVLLSRGANHICADFTVVS